MGEPQSALGIEIISRTILYMNKSSLLVKITHILVNTSHAKAAATRCVKYFQCWILEAFDTSCSRGANDKWRTSSFQRWRWKVIGRLSVFFSRFKGFFQCWNANCGYCRMFASNIGLFDASCSRQPAPPTSTPAFAPYWPKRLLPTFDPTCDASCSRTLNESQSTMWFRSLPTPSNDQEPYFPFSSNNLRPSEYVHRVGTSDLNFWITVELKYKICFYLRWWRNHSDWGRGSCTYYEEPSCNCIIFDTLCSYHVGISIIVMSTV